MSDLPPNLRAPAPVMDPHAEMERLVRRYARAGSFGLDLLNALGLQAEGLFQRLPPGMRTRLDDATERALAEAMRVAHASRSNTSWEPDWFNRVLAGALGAVGGFGGAPTALAEVPVTVVVLLREIQSEATRLGFDPAAQNIHFDCVQVFGAAGPLAQDDGADLSFLGTRMALSSGSMQALIARVAPRLATVLGQKLATQAVPLIGAATGAAVNSAYLGYYRDMAHVHFGLRKLAIETDQPHDHLVADFRRRMALTTTPPPKTD
ncbi:MAG: EcsC family protein [Pseudopelagicola sp.]|nr:EcsC family protein [Pseudopelagicola sp.]